MALPTRVRAYLKTVCTGFQYGFGHETDRQGCYRRKFDVSATRIQWKTSRTRIRPNIITRMKINFILLARAILVKSDQISPSVPKCFILGPPNWAQAGPRPQIYAWAWAGLRTGSKIGSINHFPLSGNICSGLIQTMHPPHCPLPKFEMN